MEVKRKPVPNACSNEETTPLQHGNGRHMAGKFKEIGLACFIVSIPMLVFSAVLLGLVSHFRVRIGQGLYSSLNSAGSQQHASAYYVNFSSTTLISVASWSSSLAPALVGPALTMFSFPIVYNYIQNTGEQRKTGLLTPYQLSIVLRLFTGGSWGALWSWAKYLYIWKGRRQSQAPALKGTASLVALCTCLATLVVVADTWLHFRTKTVQIILATPLSSGIPYSMGLVPSCSFGNLTGPVDALSNCMILHAATNIFLQRCETSLPVLNNISDHMIALSLLDEYVYVAPPPTAELALRDYTATTFAMQTQCNAVSTQCNLEVLDGASTPFFCSDAFQGDVSVMDEEAVYPACSPNCYPNWYLTYFTDSQRDVNETGYGLLKGGSNPFYFSLATLVNKAIDTVVLESPEIVGPMHGGTAYVLECNSTVYDVEYDSVNGTITRFDLIQSNDSVANIFKGALGDTTVGTDYLKQSASVAIFSESIEELSHKFAMSFNRASLSVGASALQPNDALVAQERSTILVTRIPKAPLYMLVFANMLFVAFGMVLAVLAIARSGGEVREIQARLSVEGLVADVFEGTRAKVRVESVDDLFEESYGEKGTRVVIRNSAQGGYEYHKLS